MDRSPDLKELARRIAAELQAEQAQPRDVFEGIPDELLDRYLAGLATQSERDHVDQLALQDRELQEALNDLKSAWTEADTAPGDDPRSPQPILMGFREISPVEPAESSPSGPSLLSKAVQLSSSVDPRENWQRVASELREYREAQLHAWRDVDLRALAQYIAAPENTSSDERRRVADVISRNSAVAEAVQAVTNALPDPMRKPRRLSDRTSAVDRIVVWARALMRKARRLSDRTVTPWAFPPRGWLVAAAVLVFATAQAFTTYAVKRGGNDLHVVLSKLDDAVNKDDLKIRDGSLVALRDNVVELDAQVHDLQAKLLQSARFDPESSRYVPNILGNMHLSRTLRQEIGTATQGRVVLHNDTGSVGHVSINGAEFPVLPGKSYVNVPLGLVSVQRPGHSADYVNSWRLDEQGYLVEYSLTDGPVVGTESLVQNHDDTPTKLSQSSYAKPSTNYYAPDTDSSETFYAAACQLSMASRESVLMGDGSKAHDAMARKQANQAVQLLKTAVHHGFNKVTRLKRDPALDPIREYPEFKQLFEELAKTQDESRSRLSITVAGPKIMHQGRVNELFVTVSNDGGASAADVLLRASLPLELAASGPNSERAIKSDELTWALGTIEPTGSREVRVRVEARSVSNQARIEFTVGDGGEPTHTSADVEIRATSNLAIETQCLDDSVDVGSQTPFVFQVTNHGPDLAKGVALVVTLPPELQAVDADGPTPFKIEGPESPEQASAPVSPSERAPNTKRQAWVGKQEPEAPAEGMKPDRQEVQKVIFEPIEGLDPKAVLTYRIRLKCVRPGNVRIAAKVNADEPLPKESVVDEIVVPCRSPRDLTHPPSSEPIPMSSY